MNLCLDIGNSQLYGGVFDGEKLVVQFRRTSSPKASSDELGLFLRAVLRENHVDPAAITRVALSSVVPPAVYSIRACCQKYFGLDPLVLRPGLKLGLNVRYKDPREVGSDRIADALGALRLFPERDLLIVDYGTATTFTAVTASREFLGGAIAPGILVSLEALVGHAARLPSVEVVPTDSALGRTTVESIQSGLFWSSVGATRELVNRLSEECFAGGDPWIVATGGLSHLFASQQLFDAIVPELILVGLHEALSMAPPADTTV
ncbi:MAG: type III pantothenate kinase [Steroidobacteraceae bacterium]